MKGIALPGGCQVKIVEASKPVAGPGKVVIKMKVAAICGSDLHIYRRTPRPGEKDDIIGHEPCGIVDSVGEGVLHVKPGQRVALYHYQGCGGCKYCAAGLLQHCDHKMGFGWSGLPGSDAEYMMCNGVNVLPLPDELSYIDGSFVACIAGTSFRALNRLNLTSRTSLCIYGLGPLGLTALKLARAMRPKQIICVDPNPARRKLGLEHGADAVFDSDENTAQNILKITGGGAECSYETSGSIAAQRNIIETASHFGKVAISGATGLYDKEGGVNLSQLIGKEICVFGSYVISMAETYELMAFMVENDVHFDSLVTHRFPIEKAAEAFELFNTNSTGKVIFEFD